MTGKMLPQDEYIFETSGLPAFPTLSLYCTPNLIAMTEKKPVASNNTGLFGKENYKWMVIGVAVMALGFFLMAGGKSADPNIFKREAFRRHSYISLVVDGVISGLGTSGYTIALLAISDLI